MAQSRPALMPSSTARLTQGGGEMNPVWYDHIKKVTDRANEAAPSLTTVRNPAAWDVSKQLLAQMTLTADAVLTPINVADGRRVTLIVDIAGHTLTYASTIKWPGGSAPSLSGLCVLTFVSRGTTLLCVAATSNLS